MADVTWMPGSLFDNIDKFANSLGYENAGIAIEFAMMSWKSPEERDAFITGITGADPKGGTEKNYIKQNFQGVRMSLWDSFRTTIGVGIKSITGGGDYLNEEEKKKQEELNKTIKNAIANIDKFTSKVPGNKLAKAAQKSTGDFLLRAANEFNDKVYSPVISRPIATLGLLTAPEESPLYTSDKYGKGFQFSDIKAAYNRTEKVTAMQALTKSTMIPLVGSISAAVLRTGDINIDEVDLWNDESIKKNFVDNGVGRWFTGIGDLYVGAKGINAAGKVAKIAAVTTVAKPLGLYTKGKTVEQLAADMETGILHASTNGAQGAQTVAGSHAVLLAGTKDWGIIEDLVGKYSTNERLIPIIHEASDANVVKDLLLADKGNAAALERVANTAPSKLFDMANVKGQIKNKILQTGELYLPEGEAALRLKSAFEDAIASNPQFKKIKDAFFDENYQPLVGGKNFMPLEPTIGTSLFIKGEEKLRGVKSAIRNREYDYFTPKAGTLRAQFAETTIGETLGGLVIKGVRLAGRGTEALPTGWVSFSGMRPLQARVELKGFLDNLELLRDGSKKIEVAPGVFEKTSIVRQRLEESYLKTLGQNPIDQVNALKAIDTQIGNMLAFKVKMYSKAEIDSYVSKFQMNTSKGIESVKKNGFGIGLDGNVTLVDPQTVRQIVDSYRFTPWDDIERQLNFDKAKGIKKAGRGANLVRQDLFQNLNSLWSYDVLMRPNYAFKQSLFEPIISAGLSQGINFVVKDLIGNGLLMTGRNVANWSADLLKRKVINRAEYKAVVQDVTDKATALELAIRIKATAQADVEDLLTIASPATKAQHLTAAQKELKAASKLVDKIELQLRDTMAPYGGREAIPSMATLERRIAYLESKPGVSSKISDIADAKAAIKNYKNIISKLATNKKVILDADKKIEDAYKKIDAAVKELSEAKLKQADVFGKSAAFKKRYHSKEKHIHVVGNAVHHVDSFIQEQSAGGTNYFTTAIREETKNARTTQNNFLGELATGQSNSLIKRKAPLTRIGIQDPTYFEELAHIANRFYRGDALMDLIFDETPMKKIVAWSKTSAGKEYLSNPAFNIHDAADIPGYLADKVALTQRMFPSFEARAAIKNGEVTSQQLQKFLSPYADRLFDITPSNFHYEINTFGQNGFAKASQAFDNFAAKTFSKLAAVENPIRAMLFDKMATENVAKKISYLAEQGFEITTDTWNSVRQAAGREALQDMEKVLYTVNNPNRFLNSLRGVMAFPTANINAFLRYGRLAAKNPVRATGVLSNYGRAYTTFGVDENGNPTDDINKITHLIVPGSKEIANLTGLGGADAKLNGVRLSAQSLGFLLNRPGPSFITSLSIGHIMKYAPGSEDDIEKFMTIGGTNWYKVYYPYGAPTSIADAFKPAWLKAAINGFVGPEGQKDYLGSWKSVYNYHAMLVEMGIEQDMPAEEQIREEVRVLWTHKFFSTFASPYAGIPYKVETNPMGLTSTLYFKLIEKYKAQKMSNQEARDAAGDEMISLLGPRFMVDRVSFTGSSKNLNLPATYEAYSRVFENNDDLVGRLSNIEPGEIGLVGLLTADLDYDPEKQSNNILSLLADPKKTLPGTSKNLNELKMTPKEIETERIKQRTWNQYMETKKALEAKITDGKTLRAHPELKAVLDNLALTVFKDQSQEWYDQWNLAESGDTSYKYARGLSEIINDTKFMTKSGNSQFWKDVKTFMDSRNMFTEVYQALPDYDPRKSQLKDAYNAWIQANIGQWDGNLKTILERYFDNDSLKAVN